MIGWILLILAGLALHCLTSRIGYPRVDKRTGEIKYP